MDIQKKDSSKVLEPDLIVSGDKILHMSDREQERVIVDGWAKVCASLARIVRGGF